MIEIVKYTNTLKKEWDEFVDKAKNGTFLFKRDFMEYHSDRFEDYSLLIYEKARLCAIFPANRHESTIHSHQGLSFGGLISQYNSKTTNIIVYFNAINNHLSINGFNNVIYKTVPQIYKTHFGQEDEYLLYLLNAKLVCCNLSSILDLSIDPQISRNRKRNFKKAQENNIIVEESNDFEKFWEVMELNLHKKYNSSSVHTSQEMELINSHFPDNIKLYLSKKEDVIVGGAVLFIFKNVVKIQYAHASEYGKSLGAIDFMYFSFINDFKNKFRYIDFGSSNMKSGKILQTTLIDQKEAFGARAVCVNTYEYNPNSISLQ